MKKLNKKGFTIVELVIVIAVIAILAAVLIPTFSGVVDKANNSAALQEARNTLTEYVLDKGENVPSEIDLIIKITDKNNKTYYFSVNDGHLKAEESEANAQSTVKPKTGTYTWSGTYDANGCLIPTLNS